MQGRAAAAAGNVRSVHTGASKLKTAAAATTRKTNNSESTPRLGRPRAELKIFALLYILVAFIFHVFFCVLVQNRTRHVARNLWLGYR